MKFKQRDVVYITVELPDGKVLEHPYVIISSGKVNSIENSYLGVMITGTISNDKYSFDLTDSMFERPLNKISQIRIRLISSFNESQVRGSIFSRMKPIPFKNLVDEITSVVLSIDRD